MTADKLYAEVIALPEFQAMYFAPNWRELNGVLHDWCLDRGEDILAEVVRMCVVPYWIPHEENPTQSGNGYMVVGGTSILQIDYWYHPTYGGIRSKFRPRDHDNRVFNHLYLLVEAWEELR